MQSVAAKPAQVQPYWDASTQSLSGSMSISQDHKTVTRVNSQGDEALTGNCVLGDGEWSVKLGFPGSHRYTYLGVQAQATQVCRWTGCTATSWALRADGYKSHGGTSDLPGGFKMNDNDIITIKDAQNSSVLLTANLSTDDGVKEFEDFFAEKGRLPSATHRPRLVAAHGASFANVGGAPDEHAVVHIVAASTVKAAGEALGDPELDWRRFRPNVLVDGTAEPWEELAWCGGRIRMGSVTLEVDEPTIRCPATRVDPSTAVVM